MSRASLHPHSSVHQRCWTPHSSLELRRWSPAACLQRIHSHPPQPAPSVHVLCHDSYWKSSKLVIIRVLNTIRIDLYTKWYLLVWLWTDNRISSFQMVWSENRSIYRMIFIDLIMNQQSDQFISNGLIRDSGTFLGLNRVGLILVPSTYPILWLLLLLHLYFFGTMIHTNVLYTYDMV